MSFFLLFRLRKHLIILGKCSGNVEREGFLVAAFLAAILSVQFMIHWLAKLGLVPFGIYRVVLAAICLFLLAHSYAAAASSSMPITCFTSSLAGPVRGMRRAKSG